ncbi:MAG: hypothetical protein ACK481_06570 [Candidatus Melainabacteria bacterium]
MALYEEKVRSSFKAVGGDTIFIFMPISRNSFEDEAKNNPTILNSWARIAPRKFNRTNFSSMEISPRGRLILRLLIQTIPLNLGYH